MLRADRKRCTQCWDNPRKDFRHYRSVSKHVQTGTHPSLLAGLSDAKIV